MLDYGHTVKRSNMNNGECDRLSGLPDDLIHKILGFVGMKHVVQTSLLSSRWRLIWTSTPYLHFSSTDFSEPYKFSDFVANVLCGRDNRIETSSVHVTTFGGKDKDDIIIRSIMDYAFSHNVQRMTITCLNGLYYWWNIEYPFSDLFSSCPSSLKHLTLIGNIKSASVMPTKVWELPAVLTTLDLKDVRLSAGGETSGSTTSSVGRLFFKCVNLKNLTLSNFDIAETTDGIVTICHPQLSNITLEDGTWRYEYLHVVTPQLKNLTVINCDGELLISAADQLATLNYKTNHTLQLLITDGRLPSLQKVDLYIRNPHMRIAFDLLQKLHNVRNLTLNLEIIEVLSSPVEVELISNQRPPLVNLKSFNLYPLNVLSRQARKILNSSTKLKSYLLDGGMQAVAS